MVYLIESSNYYKVGYTKDIKTRLRQYDTHNPDYVVLSVKSNGSKSDETALHKLLCKYQYKTEWFYKTEEVISIWETYWKDASNDYINYEYVELPSSMLISGKLKPKDLLIYLYLKSHYDPKTNTCSPSLRSLCIGISLNTVKKCIENLLKSGYVYRTTIKNRFVYSFKSYLDCQKFSYDFIYNSNYTFNEKSYLVSIQQYMHINSSGVGHITISTKELSEKLNISHDTISRLDRSLQKKQALAIIDTRAIESETHCVTKEKVFALKAYGQAIAYTLRNHEDRITENSEKIEELEKKLEESNKDRKLMYRELCRMKDQLNELQNKEIVL